MKIKPKFHKIIAENIYEHGYRNMVLTGGFTQISICPVHRRGARDLPSGILQVFSMIWAEKKIWKVLSKFRPFASHIKLKTTLNIDDFGPPKPSILRVVFDFRWLENGRNLLKTFQIFFSAQIILNTRRIPEGRSLAPHTNEEPRAGQMQRILTGCNQKRKKLRAREKTIFC